MTQSRSRPGLGIALYFGAMFAAGLYFTFAAVQGDYGLFREAEIRAEADVLRSELAELNHEVAIMDNKTRRLSDTFLDLDLLDEQARDVLGLIRHDEIVVR
ncbi:septum formation initiator family protein [Cognatishimia sp. MH4019]|uniref:FtsB family cell division protein n=1 Tax=Cognatishimia sp. MH4019 TaxID=2854030 RepID=UPI001CD56EC8|nr:septum formation initiator family protein [Cognatishimia sp. MH4019]